MVLHQFSDPELLHLLTFTASEVRYVLAVIEARSQACFIIEIECNSAFIGGLPLSITFSARTDKRSLQLELPVFGKSFLFPLLAGMYKLGPSLTRVA